MARPSAEHHEYQVDVGGDEGPHEQEKSTVEHTQTGEEVPPTGPGPVMRTREDDLGVWETLQRYKLIAFVGMCAAFTATLDGYRELPSSRYDFAINSHSDD
jgi:hypothetical protein